LPHINTISQRKYINLKPKSLSLLNTPQDNGHGAALTGKLTFKFQRLSTAQICWIARRHGAIPLKNLAPSYGTLLRPALACRVGHKTDESVCPAFFFDCILFHPNQEFFCGWNNCGKCGELSQQRPNIEAKKYEFF
jgi:hypothetical protein